MNTVLLIVTLFIVLAVLILVHEFGHFIVAKRNGIRVDEFGLGFPPRIKTLFTWKGTAVTINAIPFGGFVKIFGENGDDAALVGKRPQDSFVAQSGWVQAKVLVAGIVFNLLLAWFLVTLAFMFGVSTVVLSDDALYKHLGDDQHLIITSVLPESPASGAGLAPGDIVTNIYPSGEVREYPNLDDVSFGGFIKQYPYELLVLEYTREGRDNSVALTPVRNIVSADDASIGVSVGMAGELQLPIHKAVYRGAESTIRIFGNTIGGLVSLVGGIFEKDNTSSVEISGPVGLAGIVGDAMDQGISSLFLLVGIISVNLAVFNLIPFPALDGGRLFVLAIEKIRGKDIHPNITGVLNTVGFLLLIGLMIAVTISDIIKL